MRKTRRSLLSVLMFVLICCMMGGGFPVYAEVNANVSIDPDSPFRNGEFVGIWIRAADNLEEAKSLANEAAAHVGAVQIFLTTNWSNLNPDNKISLFVRYINPKTGEADTRIVNKYQ